MSFITLMKIQKMNKVIVNDVNCYQSMYHDLGQVLGDLNEDEIINILDVVMQYYLLWRTKFYAEMMMELSIS